jgi:hypothetical protein
MKWIMPVNHPKKNAFPGDFPSITISKGIRENQAKKERSNLGNDRVRRIPEAEDRRISFRVIPRLIEGGNLDGSIFSLKI